MDSIIKLIGEELKFIDTKLIKFNEEKKEMKIALLDICKDNKVLLKKNEEAS